MGVGPKIHHQQIFIQITGIISFQRLPPGGAEVLLETFILIEKKLLQKMSTIQKHNGLL